jgi:hypothetical protein
VSRRRQLVLGQWAPNPEFPGSLGAPQSMGTLKEVMAVFAQCNTAPDGGPSTTTGIERLYGPGIVVDIALGQPEITQALVSVKDVDCAWPVLQKLCKVSAWKMVDSDSGQVFG